MYKSSAASENMPLVYYVVQKLMRVRMSHPDFDDLIQAGSVGLVMAEKGYDQTRGAFSSYAVQSIRWHVIREFQNLKKRARVSEATKELYAFDAVAYSENFDHLLDQWYDSHLLDSVMQKIDARERRVVTMREVDRMTLAECGKKLGVTKERARQLFQRGMRHLQNEAAKLKNVAVESRGRPAIRKNSHVESANPIFENIVRAYEDEA